MGRRLRDALAVKRHRLDRNTVESAIREGPVQTVNCHSYSTHRRLDGDALSARRQSRRVRRRRMQPVRGPPRWGQVELSSRVLNRRGRGMLGQILPLDQRATLEEFGATHYEVASDGVADERFTIVAARGGDDIWLEIRRQPKPVPEPVAAAEPEIAVAAVHAAADVETLHTQPHVSTDVAPEDAGIVMSVATPVDEIEQRELQASTSSGRRVDGCGGCVRARSAGGCRGDRLHRARVRECRHRPRGAIDIDSERSRSIGRWKRRSQPRARSGARRS